MAYERYKQIKGKEEFFAQWDKNKIDSTPRDIKYYVYQDYVAICETLQRDNFTCQAKIAVEKKGATIETNCPYCNNTPYYHKLTRHHIIPKSKKGPNTSSNQITWCKGVHGAFNAGKVSIIGHPNEERELDEIDWKKKKVEMKKVRNEIKQRLIYMGKLIKFTSGEERVWFELNIEQIKLLMKWLFIPYDEMEELEGD